MKSLIADLELRCSRPLLLAIALLLLSNAQITAQPASGSNPSPTPSVTQASANQANQTNRSTASADSGKNAQSGDTGSANSNAAPTESQLEIQINGSTAKGPTAAVL